jgi:hypothetical protein
VTSVAERPEHNPYSSEKARQEAHVHRRAMAYFTPDWPLIAVLVILISMTVSVGILEAWPLAILIDSVLTDRPQPGILTFTSLEGGSSFLRATRQARTPGRGSRSYADLGPSVSSAHGQLGLEPRALVSARGCRSGIV